MGLLCFDKYGGSWRNICAFFIGFGCDLSETLLQTAAASAAKAGVGELIEFKQTDLFEVKLDKFTHIYLYQLPDVLTKLVQPLLQYLNSTNHERVVVSVSWSLPPCLDEFRTHIGVCDSKSYYIYGSRSITFSHQSRKYHNRSEEKRRDSNQCSTAISFH